MRAPPGGRTPWDEEDAVLRAREGRRDSQSVLSVRRRGRGTRQQRMRCDVANRHSNKRFLRAIRERMLATGERYQAARDALLAGDARRDACESACEPGRE